MSIDLGPVPTPGPEGAEAMTLLARAAALLAVVGILATAGPARADSTWAETRYVDGKPQTVYTNSGAATFRREIRQEGSTLRNSRPALRPRTFQELPPGTPAATGTVPREFAFSTFDAGKRPPRPVSCLAWVRDASGQMVRRVAQVDLNEIIIRHARTHNVDPLLVELVIRHESNFNPQAVSPAGAQGLMQLMPGTAVGLGVWDPFDPDQNVGGGVRYIANQLRRFKDVRLALAAYNAGPGAVLEYGGVPPYAETRYYVDTIYSEYRTCLAARSRTRSK